MNALINTSKPNDEIIDLDLSVTKKKKFRFDKDDSRIVELNTSDMNILTRFEEVWPKLTALQETASKITDGLNTEGNNENIYDDMVILADRLRTIDSSMRELIDFLFNSNVSAVAAPDGSMYDPFEGSFRFEYIIDLLLGQYSTNISTEFSKMEKQIKSHTDKYTQKG